MLGNVLCHRQEFVNVDNALRCFFVIFSPPSQHREQACDGLTKPLFSAVEASHPAICSVSSLYCLKVMKRSGGSKVDGMVELR